MRRAVIYLFYDKSGQVDDYVTYNLEKLREHAELIFVVSNSVLTETSKQKLSKVADTVWERANNGFDVYAYKESLEKIGWERLDSFDEVILMNYTFFGPIHPYADMFNRMDAIDTDFWGISAHKAVRPHPFTVALEMPLHIQSHWIAVRHKLLASTDFRQYWATMPPINSYTDSVVHHESRFTKHFADLGWRYEVAWPAENYPAVHPIFDNAALMLADGCPILKRRLFFHDPLYLDKQAIIGADIMREVRRAGYPEELIWQNVSHNAKPRVLSTNFNLTQVLDDNAEESVLAANAKLRIAGVAHVFYADMTAEIMKRFSYLGDHAQIFLTTSTPEKKTQIEQQLQTMGRQAEVRIVESNRGRDVSAFLVTCADVLEPGRFDVVAKIHSKKSAQDAYNAAELFKRHLFENLLPSPGYTANLLHLFATEPYLGMVFPPAVSLGYPTLGHAWFANKKPALALCERLGIKLPFDDTTPLSPYGSMFFARPEALLPLTKAHFTFNDFPEEGQYSDGSLAHVIERIFSYSSLSEGLICKSVMNREWAGIYYGFMEYRVQALLSQLPGFPLEAVTALQNRRPYGLLPELKLTLQRRSPHLAKTLRPFYLLARQVYHKVRSR